VDHDGDPDARREPRIRRRSSVGNEPNTSSGSPTSRSRSRNLRRRRGRKERVRIRDRDQVAAQISGVRVRT